MQEILRVLSAREKLAVSDVTNLPNKDINCQSISIYGDFVTSLNAYYSYTRVLVYNILYYYLIDIYLVNGYEVVMYKL